MISLPPLPFYPARLLRTQKPSNRKHSIRDPHLLRLHQTNRRGCPKHRLRGSRTSQRSRSCSSARSWPYDIYSFTDVAPLLAAKGYRVIVPYLRGSGTTTFLSSTTIRNAQQSAVAQDIIALMDALKIQTATIAGFDWGARTRRRHGHPLARNAAKPSSPSAAISSTTPPLPRSRQLPPQAAFAIWYRATTSPAKSAGLAMRST